MGAFEVIWDDETGGGGSGLSPSPAEAETA